jgi:hypothetical protein
MCDSRYVSRTAARIPRPRWGLLYGVVVLGLGMLTLTDMAAPEVVRPGLDGVLAVAAVMAIARWVRANRAALEQQEWCECAAERMTVRVVPCRRAEPLELMDSVAARADVAPGAESTVRRSRGSSDRASPRRTFAAGAR